MKHIGLWCALLLAFGQTAARGGPTLVTVPAAEVRGDRVLLRDLVSGHQPLPDGWGERVVLRAPEPGRAEQYSISAIAYALQQYPDMKDVTLRGTLNTTVRRAVMSVPPEQIVQAIEQYVHTHAPWQGTAVQVVCDGLNRVDRLPAGDLTLGIVGAEPSADAPDRYTFKVGLQVDDALVRTLAVSAAMVPLKDVWVAARTLTRGHTLTAGDLDVRRQPWKNDESLSIAADQNVVGLEVGLDLKPGQTLTRRHVLQPLYVRNGDSVMVSSGSGGLTLSLQAKALAAGRRGDRILLLNEQSKRRFLATVVDYKTATLDAPAPH